MKIKKGDNVIIIAGKDKGKTGKVSQVFPKDNLVVVDGVNTRVKHMRSKRQGEKGQRLEFSAPIQVSNVMLQDSKTGKRTRISWKVLENGEKVRLTKKSQEVI